MVDVTGTVVNSYSYDIYGNIESANEAGGTNPIRYAGQYYDNESDMYYLRARYYDPGLMRFISEDSYKGDVKDPLSLNLYTYCTGNPITLVDIDGHAPQGVWALNREGAFIGTGGGGVLLYTLYNWLVQASPYINYASQNAGNFTNAANAIKDKIGDSSSGNQDPNKWDKDKIKNLYKSIKEAPKYPEGFKEVQNGLTKNLIKDKPLLSKLREVEPGKWYKVYKDGFDAAGRKISIHYFQSQSGQVFDVKVVSGWSNL